MPMYLATNVGSIYKYRRTGNTEAHESTPSYTNVNMGIVPNGNTVIESEGIAAYQQYDIFIHDITVDIDNGDKIVSGSSTYYVTGSPNRIDNRYVQIIYTQAKQVM